jgi:hypothetical protein
MLTFILAAMTSKTLLMRFCPTFIELQNKGLIMSRLLSKQEYIQNQLERDTDTESLRFVCFVEIPKTYGWWFLAKCLETNKHYHVHVNHDEYGFIITEIVELD